MPLHVIVLDLDNTLYDWSTFFARAFRAAALELSQLSDLSYDDILNEAAWVFRKHDTIEYGFWIQELPSMLQRHPDMAGHEIARLYWPAVETFKSIRRELLVPYPGVVEGLARLKTCGYTIVTLTEAMHWHAEHRLSTIGVTHLVDWLVARPDYAIPSHTDFVAVSGGLPRPASPRRFVGLPAGFRKPDPDLVRYIAGALGSDVTDMVIVGDSLAKDIAMAQAAGANDVWAEYGNRIAPEDLGLLRAVTNWSAEEVKMSRKSRARGEVEPSHIAGSFREVVSLAEHLL